MSTPQPTPETDEAWASWPYAGPGVHANFARKLERERDEAREELENWKASGIHSCHAACKRPLCVANRSIKDMHAVLRRVEVLATGLNKHGPQGLSRRTARAILAALAPVLPGVEAPPFVDTTT